MMELSKKRNLTHRDFFEFQNRINAIVAEYDISELESFYRTSKRSFPHIAEIVREMILLAGRGGDSEGRSSMARDSQFKIESYAPNIRRLNPEFSDFERGRIEGLPLSPKGKSTDEAMNMLDILNSRIVFLTNKDLGRFAIDELDLKIGWEWDSRKNLSFRVWERINALPSPKREKVARNLRNLAIHRGLPPSAVEDNGFFSVWEKVISDQVKKRDR